MQETKGQGRAVPRHSSRVDGRRASGSTSSAPSRISSFVRRLGAIVFERARSGRRLRTFRLVAGAVFIGAPDASASSRTAPESSSITSLPIVPLL